MSFKRQSKQYKIFAVILAILAIGLVAWSGYLAFAGFGSIKENWLAAALLVLCAIGLEAYAMPLPGEGHLSLAYAFYVPIFALLDFPLAVLAAGAGLIVREIARNRQNVFCRLTDFSIPVISVCISGSTFSLAAGASPLLGLRGMAALVLGSLCYYGADYLLRFASMTLTDAEQAREFARVWKRYIYYHVSLAPLSFLIAFTAGHNLALALICALPLYAIQKGINSSMQEVAIHDQRQLLETIESLKETSRKNEEDNRELHEELSQRAEEQAIIMEMGQSLGTSVDLQETLEIVVQMIRKLMPYQSCVIFLIENGVLNATKPVTPYKDILTYSSLLKLEETFVNMVVQNKKPILIPDMQLISEQRIFKDEKSLVCVPLIVKNEIIGVIYVGAVSPGTYNENHQRLLMILGNAASNAIRSAQLYKEQESILEETRETNEQLNAQNKSFSDLLNLGEKLGSSLNIEEAQKAIIDGLEEMFQYETAVLFDIEQIGEEMVLNPAKFRSPYEEQLEDFQISLDEDNVLSRVCTLRRPFHTADTRKDRLTTLIEEERSIMVAPMIVENEVTGAIYLGHSRPDYFSEDDMRHMAAVAQNAAMTLKNANKYEEAHIRSITDGLTGLYTHRYFQERLTEEIAHARRRKMTLALLMIDADNFKNYNDTLGHPAGDQVLKKIAEILHEDTRDSDIVCRIGGDEFTILLKEIDKKNAKNKADKILEDVENEFKTHQVKITTSIGLACFPEDGADKKDLIAAADAAVYKSKKGGRNRVTLAEGPVKEFKKEALPRQ
jgi:diguanylate cyclase (GGDEF)-like protein